MFLACESLLCVSGAVNTQGFVWKFFKRYIKNSIHVDAYVLVQMKD